VVTPRSLTVESLTEAARENTEAGRRELAQVFEGLAEKVARFNEMHPHTAQELASHFGEEAVIAMLFGDAGR
jgi:hypothetical protein